MSALNRRDWLLRSGAVLAGSGLLGGRAAAEEERRFAPTPGR